MSIYINDNWSKISQNLCKMRCQIRKKELPHKKFTIISNTCIGGVIYNNMGLEFNSPTINLYIRPKDFIKFCKDIHYYINLPLTELPYNHEIGYPVVTIANEITLYCKHYKNFKEIQNAWIRRKKRIDWNHICFMMTDRDFIPPFSLQVPAAFCGEDVLNAFNELPYSHKVCFVKNSKYAQKYESCVQVSKHSDPHCVGVITELATITGKHLYECAKDWDYITFLNAIYEIPS